MYSKSVSYNVGIAQHMRYTSHWQKFSERNGRSLHASVFQQITISGGRRVDKWEKIDGLWQATLPASTK